MALVSCFGLECMDFEESSYTQLPGRLKADYKLQISACKKNSSPIELYPQTIPDCIRYIIGVFCYITEEHSCFILTH